MATQERDSVLVRMSPRLKEKIQREALREKTNMTTVINTILSEHYGLKYNGRNLRSTPFGGGKRK